MLTIIHYLTDTGRDVFLDWHASLKDLNGKIAIDKRLARLEFGNFGDHKHCQDGVWELRIQTGPGYRVYYAMTGDTVVLLLCAGSKRTQSADIKKACEYWQNWKSRQKQ